MFRDKFCVSLALTIPVVLLSDDVQVWVGYSVPPFPGDHPHVRVPELRAPRRDLRPAGVLPVLRPGQTRPRAVFEDTLAAQRRLLAVAQELPDEARSSFEAAGGVTALAERALTGIVAATQNVAKRLHAKGGKTPPKASPWQNVDRLQRQWLADFDQDPLGAGSIRPPSEPCDSPFTPPPVEHNGGVIDERYQRETGEGASADGYASRPNFVDHALDAVVVLAGRLEATAR